MKPTSSTHLLNLVQAQRHPGPEWAFFRELSNGTGAQAGRHLDAWAMNTWPSHGFRTVAYEAKVSRGDFAREIADPTKRAAAEAVAGECWFLTPAGLVKPDEVPEGWGLVEAREDGTLINRKIPLQRKPEPPSLTFFAAVARRSSDPKIDPEVAKLFGRELRLEHLARLSGAFGDRRHQRRADPQWGDEAPDSRRDRTRWIERTLNQVLGYGATRSEETLRARLTDRRDNPNLSAARHLLNQVRTFLEVEMLKAPALEAGDPSA